MKMQLAALMKNILGVLGLYPETKPNKVSYITMVLAIVFPWLRGGSELFPFMIMQMLLFLLGIMVVLIVRKVLRGYLPRLIVSSGIYIVLVLAIEYWRYEGNVQRAVDKGELMFSIWGFILYFPLLWWFVKNIIRVFINMLRYGVRTNDTIDWSDPSDWCNYMTVDIPFVVVSIVIICPLVFFCICFFGYGMYSIMIIRGLAELLKVLDQWVPESKVRNDRSMAQS